MEIKTTLVKQGGTIYLRLPPVLLSHLQIVDEETTIVVQDEKGKHGNYFTAWKENKDEN